MVEEASTTYTTAISPNSGSPRPRIGNYGAGGGEEIIMDTYKIIVFIKELQNTLKSFMWGS